MFTGIVTALGKILSIQALGGADAGVRLSIDAGSLGLHDVALGDSICIQGACMTVVEIVGNTFSIDVSRESLSKTAGLYEVGDVNLEKSLTLATKLGGHLVSGHVDGLGTVSRFEAVGESWLLEIQAPRALAKYFAYKGSVTINGVSLTVNQVVDQASSVLFQMNLIPHTVQVTTLRHLQPGQAVNLEVDLIARYVERMLSTQWIDQARKVP
jgi:riboflavin synthase